MSENLKKQIEEDPKVREMVLKLCRGVQAAIPEAKIIRESVFEGMGDVGGIFEDMFEGGMSR